MEKQFEFIDIIHALEQAELAPLLLPVLKIVDPIAREIPEGRIRQYLTRIHPKEGQFRFLEKLTPRLPATIRWAGKIASIRPLMDVFAVLAEVLAVILRVVMPVTAFCIRSIFRLSGYIKKRFIGLKH